MSTKSAAPGTALDVARECLYRFLALALSDPYTERWQLLFDFENQQLAREAAELLRQETRPAALGFGELPPERLDLGQLLLELLRPVGQLREEHDRVFGLVPARECPPYETEYHPAKETFFRAQQLADVAGFYRAFGIEPATLAPERPDHVALELEFMAFLLLKRRLAADATEVEVCEAAVRTFFHDHLVWWLPSFLTGLRRKAAGGYYGAVGEVLAALLPLERAVFEEPPPRLPLPPALIERPEEATGCGACVTPA
jgi:TorA maturation chaperone TorD